MQFPDSADIRTALRTPVPGNEIKHSSRSPAELSHFASQFPISDLSIPGATFAVTGNREAISIIESQDGDHSCGLNIRFACPSADFEPCGSRRAGSTKTTSMSAGI